MDKDTREAITHIAMALVGVVIAATVGFWWGLLIVLVSGAIGISLGKAARG